VTRERELRDVRTLSPGRVELGPKGEQHQDRQVLHLLDQQIEQLEGRRVDPVKVLVDCENRLAGCQSLDLGGQDLERALLLAS
jgi:hypothetical protein